MCSNFLWPQLGTFLFTIFIPISSWHLVQMHLMIEWVNGDTEHQIWTFWIDMQILLIELADWGSGLSPFCKCNSHLNCCFAYKFETWKLMHVRCSLVILTTLNLILQRKCNWFSFRLTFAYAFRTLALFASNAFFVQTSQIGVSIANKHCFCYKHASSCLANSA